MCIRDRQNVTVPVSHEEVRVEREPITDANVGAAMDGPALSEEEHEVVLHAEVPNVEKTTVPVERVRLGTETVPVSREEIRVEREPITDANVGNALDGPAISEEVRKERIDVDDDKGRGV